MININPRAFFFDFDGVVVDSEKLHMIAALKAVGTRGLSFTEEHYFATLLGYDDVGLFSHIWDENQRELDKTTLKNLISEKNAAFLKLIAEKKLFFEGIHDFVLELARNHIPMAIVSGALENEILGCLAQGNLAHHFKFIVSADKVKISKPDPESYEQAWENMLTFIPDLEKSECWAIEDSPAGITAAREAGLNVIGITNSVPASQLSLADHIIKSVREITLEF